MNTYVDPRTGLLCLPPLPLCLFVLAMCVLSTQAECEIEILPYQMWSDRQQGHVRCKITSFVLRLFFFSPCNYEAACLNLFFTTADHFYITTLTHLKSIFITVKAAVWRKLINLGISLRLWVTFVSQGYLQSASIQDIDLLLMQWRFIFQNKRHLRGSVSEYFKKIYKHIFKWDVLKSQNAHWLNGKLKVGLLWSNHGILELLKLTWLLANKL